jgi:outer membrane lipoprotein-sorting protein
MILLLLTSVIKAAGQPVTDQFKCSRELYNLMYPFSDTPHVSFQVQQVTIYKDGTNRTVFYKYKVGGRKMHLEGSDSTTIIQNGQCSFTINHSRHQAVVGVPVNVFNYVARVKILDSSFYASYVTGMAMSDTVGYEKLSFRFKPNSVYRSYDIIYDKATRRIQFLQYSVNLNGGRIAASGAGMYEVTMTFSNYQTGQFNDSVFSTDGYFLRRQGVCSMVAPYTSYTIKNLLNQ